MPKVRYIAVGAVVVAGFAITAWSGSAAAAGASGTPVKVGMIYSKTGPLSAYGEEYRQGFEAGLKYATHGTGAVDGHKIEVTWDDGAGNPSQAVSEAKTLIGNGYKILAGPTDSGVSLQVAPVAAQNQVLYISGPAAADEITGINKYTFRSGRQSYQDVKTAAAMITGSIAGKSILVFAQNYAFGKANVDAVKAVLGGEGAKVTSILAPLSTQDFTPFALKIKNAHPDLLFVAWAGSSTNAMWTALEQQGVFKTTKVVTGLGNVASYDSYGPAATKVEFLSYYFPDAPHNAVNKEMKALITKAGGKPDLFSPDGFVAAQMIARAVEATHGDGNVDQMIKALDGWTFEAPKGKETIRAADHAMIQPEYIAKLVKQGNGYAAKLVKTVPADKIAPPVVKMK